jgi:hypothetical protein
VKLKTIVASVVLCSLMMDSQALAHVTIYGGTGLVFNPTADIVPAGRINTQFSYWREKPNGSSGAFSVSSLSADSQLKGYSLGVAFSLHCFCNFCRHSEFSLGFQSVKGYGTDGGYIPPEIGDEASNESRVLRQGSLPLSSDRYTKVVSAGAKYLVKQETETSPAVAGGVQFDNLFKRGTAYLVASRTLNPQPLPPKEGMAWRVHAGVRFDRIDASRSATGADESEFSIFGGIEAALSRRLRLMGEVQSRDKALTAPPISATLHYALSDQAGVFGGLSRIGATRDTGWIVGVNYGFGKTQ